MIEELLAPWASLPDGWTYDHRPYRGDVEARRIYLDEGATEFLAFLEANGIDVNPGVPHEAQTPRPNWLEGQTAARSNR